jgi:hypothetical protein
MPFVSKAQRAFMYAKHPEIAKEFEEKTAEKELPEKIRASPTRKYKKLNAPPA